MAASVRLATPADSDTLTAYNLAMAHVSMSLQQSFFRHFRNLNGACGLGLHLKVGHNSSSPAYFLLRKPRDSPCSKVLCRKELRLY